MADTLAIWLRGDKVALVAQERSKKRLRLHYTEAALKRYPLNVPLLSLSLPLRPEPYAHGVVAPFLDGLLPEGESRLAIAADLDLLASDTYGLIRALGRDCAGALIIQPDEEPLPPQPTIFTAEPINDVELGELVANLRSAPLGVGGRVRVSLAGVQEKLLLTRMNNGAWGRPVDGTPSTHILKPELAAYPNTVENEAFCMRLAKNLGLQVAAVETTTVRDRKLLVVERYDRLIHPDGSVERIHQEDFCQAVGLPPQKKYQEDGGPSLRRMANILQSSATGASMETLLRAVTLNVVIGNGDAHAKNFSLLHDPSGVLRLAPLYDLLSTLFYNDDRLAMYVDDVRRTNRVTADRLLNEAVSWGLARPRAYDVVADILDGVPSAADAAQSETNGLPSGVRGAVDSQVAQLLSAFTAAGESTNATSV